MSVTTRLQGTVVSGPPVVTIGAGLSESEFPLTELEQFNEQNAGVTKLDALAIDVDVPFGGVEKAMFIVLKVGALVSLKVTSTDGATTDVDQIVPCDGTFLVKCRKRWITQIKVTVGPAAVALQYLIAGN